MRVAILSSILAIAAAGEGCSDGKAPLLAKASSTGLSFKVLQVPDIHFTGNPATKCNGGVANLTRCTEAYMELTLGIMLDDVKPDLVVFTGDQIEALSRPTTFNAEKEIRAYSKHVIDRKLPWAMVYGNHDENHKKPQYADKDAQMKLIESLPYSYSMAGPKGIGGVSNYHLNVKTPQDGFWGHANRDIFRMYFVDTGKAGNVTKPQMDYFKSLAADYRPQNIPAIMFFHIPPIHYNNFTAGQGQGGKGEAVTYGKDNAALFDTMVAMGDVKASFVGHDHYNDYCFLEKPIHLCYGGGVGYGSAYGQPKYSRRARVIEWSLTAGREEIHSYIYRQTAPNDFENYTIFERQP